MYQITNGILNKCIFYQLNKSHETRTFSKILTLTLKMFNLIKS